MATYTVVYTSPLGVQYQSEYTADTQEEVEDRAEALRLRSQWYVDARVVAIDGVPVQEGGE